MVAGKRPSVDETLSKLHALRTPLRENPADATALDAITKALKSSVHLIVAKAADIAREAKVESISPQLAETFERFLDARPDADKGCAAKIALASALADLAADAQALFLRGIRVVQMEPVWGGSEDVAAALRGACALGLVNCGYRHTLIELGDLLMDPYPAARMAAAKGIAAWGREEGAPLLRMKALAGDANAEVIGECLLGVIVLRSPNGVEFVARFLHHRDPGVAESAALALGESRQAEALDVLRNAYLATSDAEFRRVLLLCIAITRLPQAMEFLLGELATGEVTSAADAIAALAMYKHDTALVARVRDNVAARKSKPLTQAFAKHFDSTT